MPQYKRVGHDFTMELGDNANPDFWEPAVAPEPEPAKSTKAPAPESKESE